MKRWNFPLISYLIATHLFHKNKNNAIASVNYNPQWLCHDRQTGVRKATRSIIFSVLLWEVRVCAPFHNEPSIMADYIRHSRQQRAWVKSGASTPLDTNTLGLDVEGKRAESESDPLHRANPLRQSPVLCGNRHSLLLCGRPSALKEKVNTAKQT